MRYNYYIQRTFTHSPPTSYGGGWALYRYLYYKVLMLWYYLYDIIFRYNINTISIYPRPASEGGRVRYHITPDPYLRTFGRRRIGWLASPTLLLIISFEYFIFYYILHIIYSYILPIYNIYLINPIRPLTEARIGSTDRLHVIPY